MVHNLERQELQALQVPPIMAQHQEVQMLQPSQGLLELQVLPVLRMAQHQEVQMLQPSQGLLELLVLQVPRMVQHQEVQMLQQDLEEEQSPPMAHSQILL